LEYDPKGGSGGAGGGSGTGGGEGDDAQRVPLLVVAQGATYSLTEKTAKRIVTSVVERVVADYTRVAANSGELVHCDIISLLLLLLLLIIIILLMPRPKLKKNF